MATKKFEKGSQEYEMFFSIWQLAQKYYVVEPDNDEYHLNILRDANAFREKYDTPWGKALSKAVIWAVQDYEMTAK